MTDVVVTVPKSFGLDAWIAEGDAAGEPWSGQEWGFYMGGHPPKIDPGERVYVVYNGKLRGYAPLIRLETYDPTFWDPDDPLAGKTRKSYVLVRGGGAVAVTIDREIRGFQGFRYRDWPYSDERPFPDWRVP